MTSPAHADQPHRVGKPFFTFGTLTLLIFMGIGFSFGLTRMVLGLGAVTNLDNHNPWGIWIAFDVACGVALAAGGFTTAALIDIFGRKRYLPVLRPALLTAFLGYLWVAIALSFDLGRYWNMWRPIFHWQGNSVLFEVGICVTAYLMVLSVEMSPAVLEGLQAWMSGEGRAAALLRRLETPVRLLYAGVRIALPLCILAGVVLSCMHQSSLGALMLIAPSKLSALWNTPILPLLFLLSALMVGFPMVILESIYANISFGRNPEMELLTPLARVIPWFIGLYGMVKIGDLIVRSGQLRLLEHPAATTSLAIEIFAGILAPFLLLLHPAVRRSIGWLFFTVSLIIFGVVLNRINVFLVGYRPPLATTTYFPSVGEIAMTIAIVSSILFCYRVFVTFFPILPGYVPETEAQLERLREERERTVSPFWTWAIRIIAVALMLDFITLYNLVHFEAHHMQGETVTAIRPVAPARPGAAAASPQRPAGYRNYYFLNSGPLSTQADDYEPVRFSHRIHDGLSGGDCGVCHHRHAAAAADRVGVDIRELHAPMEIRLGGACAACHDDMTKNAPQGCARCHRGPNEPDAPTRPGLKGAYHRQCIGCHERQRAGTAPTACATCHHPWTPDHAKLVAFPGTPGPPEVTRSCLGCHAKVGQDVLKTAHWSRKGHSPTPKGYGHRIDTGLSLLVNPSCLAVGSTPQACGACHIGYGWTDATFDFANPANIDCLVCHDTTGTYRKGSGTGGLPDPALDLAAIAKRVGRPSRQSCGSCHIGSAGYAKHGDLEPALKEPPADADMHMGRLQMRCQDCHTAAEHRIAGMRTGAAAEGRARCELCHGKSPHGVTGALGRHLDNHIKAVACETCHTPSTANTSPTLVRRDYSQAGRNLPVQRDAHGMPLYDKRFGALTWGKRLVPTYLWADGTWNGLRVGDPINPATPVLLRAPVGEPRDPMARIAPFQAHAAIQPYDTEQKRLVLPKLPDGYWVDFDWAKAIAAGMRQAGLPFSGQYGFVETRTYSAVHHQVVAAKQALGCADCHRAEAVACARCHRSAKESDLPERRHALYPEVRNRLDFKALGYNDDPAQGGGRFSVGIGRGTPPR